jgi:V-type H+-transporting ATPase subunit A
LPFKCDLQRYSMGDLMYRIASMKFEDPADGEAAVVHKLSELGNDLHASFRQLEDEFR